ncbi:hypothetical protein HN747_01635 [archaeon]|jgi:hypothetical protein|nr:hypothetical protein [archaeon]
MYIGTEDGGIMLSGHNHKFPYDSLDETASKLASLVPKNIDWAVTGGFAMDLAAGKQLRGRSDLDICVHVDNLQDVVDFSGNSGYRVGFEYFRLPYFVFIDSIRFPKKVNFDKNKIKFIKLFSSDFLNGGRRDITSMIDVFPFEYGEGVVRGFYPREFEFPLSSRSVLEYSSSSGAIVPFHGPEYIILVKGLLVNKKHKMDLKFLTNSKAKGN